MVILEGRQDLLVRVELEEDLRGLEGPPAAPQVQRVSLQTPSYRGEQEPTGLLGAEVPPGQLRSPLLEPGPHLGGGHGWRLGDRALPGL